MSGKRLALLLLLPLAASAAICTGMVSARDAGAASGYQVVRDAAGALKLRITTETAAENMWLGVTLYPPNVKEGRSQVMALQRGKDTHEISLAPSFANGTFEAAVWTRKLSKQECEQNDAICRKNGFRLTGMVSYLWGYLIAPTSNQ